MSAAPTPADDAPARSPSGWSPLRYTAFRRWWVANLTSNVGSWMQTVAAQWVMISLTSSAVLIGAIQATNLPVLALAIPGGVLGDLLDRKRLILFGQFVMLLSAAALGVLDVAGAVTPAVLLIVLCGIGVGQRDGVFHAADWRLFVDNAAPRRYVEVFLVESWEEHERQHERETQHDASLLEKLDGLLVPGTHRVGHHYLAAPREPAPDDSVP